MPILKTSHKNYGSDSLVNLVLFLCYGLLNNKEIQIIVLIFRDSKLLLLLCVKKFNFCGLLKIVLALQTLVNDLGVGKKHLFLLRGKDMSWKK